MISGLRLLKGKFHKNSRLSSWKEQHQKHLMLNFKVYISAWGGFTATCCLCIVWVRDQFIMQCTNSNPCIFTNITYKFGWIGSIWPESASSKQLHIHVEPCVDCITRNATYCWFAGLSDGGWVGCVLSSPLISINLLSMSAFTSVGNGWGGSLLKNLSIFDYDIISSTLSLIGTLDGCIGRLLWCCLEWEWRRHLSIFCLQ